LLTTKQEAIWIIKMFEQTLEEIKTIHFISPSMYQILIADNVGIDPSIISPNYKEYSYFQAIEIIKALDKALISCPKYLFKRIKSERLSMTFAFGQEMEEVCGRPPESRK